MTDLHIGKGPHGFRLPLTFVTSTQAILARKRSGKSYAASVQAEELLRHKQQVVIVDPTSAWWGIRGSADGVGPGYPVYVFGGDHADAPLEPYAGKTMARAVVEHGFSAIFDIGSMLTLEQIQFVTDFSSELLRLNRTAIHVFIDEADTFAPQMLEGREQKKCLGAVSRLVKQGGIRGVGITMITQRAASMNKNVLSQVDILTILRMSHPLDIKAVTDWIKSEVSVEFAKQVEPALPSLPVGTAFVCSASLNIGERIEVRERHTFNSGATPKPGERKIEPKILAAVDIAKLGQEIAASAKRAKDDSPEELKKRIAELERKGNAPDQSPRLQELETEAKTLREALSLSQQRLRYAVTFAHGIHEQIEKAVIEMGKADFDVPETKPFDIRRPFVDSPATATIEDRLRSFGRESVGKVLKTLSQPTNGSTAIPAGERQVLIVLAQHGALERAQISVFSGYTKRSTRDAYIQRLATKGYVQTEGGRIAATKEGLAALGPYEKLPTGSRLRDWWLGQLPEGEAQVLRAACRYYPDAPITREAISSITGYEKRSTRDAYIQRLAQKLLVSTTAAGVSASPSLFD